jgi:diacylglycerol kinase family enzyme
MWERDALEQAACEPAFADNCRCIVAAGGDGTISRIISHCTAVPLAVLPLGTENLFALQFDFTHDVERLADRIAGGKTTTIDLASANGQPFSVVASAGFDGDVAHRLARWRIVGEKLRRVRRHTYLRHITASALRYDYPPIDLVADGQAVRGHLVMVFNIPQYGFNFRLMPGADPADGLLDWLVFERPGRLKLAGYALSLVLRRHLERGDVRHGRAKVIELRTAGPVPMEMDGEAAGFTPTRIEALPGALRVIT